MFLGLIQKKDQMNLQVENVSVVNELIGGAYENFKELDYFRLSYRYLFQHDSDGKYYVGTGACAWRNSENALKVHREKFEVRQIKPLLIFRLYIYAAFRIVKIEKAPLTNFNKIKSGLV
jgi:hypothetical protein